MEPILIEHYEKIFKNEIMYKQLDSNRLTLQALFELLIIKDRVNQSSIRIAYKNVRKELIGSGTI